MSEKIGDFDVNLWNGVGADQENFNQNVFLTASDAPDGLRNFTQVDYEDIQLKSVVPPMFRTAFV